MESRGQTRDRISKVLQVLTPFSAWLHTNHASVRSGLKDKGEGSEEEEEEDKHQTEEEHKAEVKRI